MFRRTAGAALAACALMLAACGMDEPATAQPAATPTGRSAATPTQTAETPTAQPTGQVAPPPVAETPDPSPTRQPVTSNQPIPQPGDIAPDFTLPSANSDPVTLSQLAARQPVALVFYRAYW